MLGSGVCVALFGAAYFWQVTSCPRQQGAMLAGVESVSFVATASLPLHGTLVCTARCLFDGYASWVYIVYPLLQIHSMGYFIVVQVVGGAQHG